MPTRREENYRLLQGQNEIGSKENLCACHGFNSGQEPEVSLIHSLKAPANVRNIVILLLLLSGASNVLLAALLTSHGSYPSFQGQKVIHTEPSDISPYG